jgi:hypothetical protein
VERSYWLVCGSIRPSEMIRLYSGRCAVRTPDLALVAVRWLLRRAGALRPRQRADELPADSEEEAITHVALQLWRGRDVWAEFRCC